MSRNEKKHTPLVFCFVFGHISSSQGLRVFGSSVFVTAGIVFITRIAHQGESAFSTGIAHKVSTVIKSSITRATQAVLVLITL
jgi:hypothetical protein